MTDYGNPLLTDWELWRVILGTFLITFGAAGAAGGGIGGGGLYVPLLIMVIGLETKEAVPISQGCIVGAAIAHFILNVPKRHPYIDQPLMDYAALLVLEPMLLAGSIFGVMVNGMLPSVVILIVLICVLSLGSYKTSKRAMKITRSEHLQTKTDLLDDEDNQVAKNVEMVTSDTNTQKIIVETEDAGADAGTEAGTEAGADEGKTPTATVDDEAAVRLSSWEYVMWKKLGMVAGLWIILSVSILIRGSSAGEESFAGILYCSAGFWGMTVAIPLIQICFSALFGKIEIDKASLQSGAIQRTSSKALLDYNEVEWNWINVMRYMVYAFVCGLLAGCLGIGGGLVLSPLLLELGFFPAVASAISGMAVLVTSTSALFAYGLSNKVYWQFVILLMPLTFISTMVGKILIDGYAERNNKQSSIIWSVAIFLVLCLIMLSIRGLIELASDASFEFSSPCGDE